MPINLTKWEIITSMDIMRWDYLIFDWETTNSFIGFFWDLFPTYDHGLIKRSDEIEIYRGTVCKIVNGEIKYWLKDGLRIATDSFMVREFIKKKIIPPIWIPEETYFFSYIPSILKDLSEGLSDDWHDKKELYQQKIKLINDLPLPIAEEIIYNF